MANGIPSTSWQMRNARCPSSASEKPGRIRRADSPPLFPLEGGDDASPPLGETERGAKQLFKVVQQQQQLLAAQIVRYSPPGLGPFVEGEFA
jgi:hypothetical protein